MNGLSAATTVLGRLLTDTTVTSKLSVINNYPAALSGNVLPQEWPITTKSINVYVLTEASGLEYTKIRLSISCRSASYKESRELAYAVHTSIDRWNLTGFSVTASVLETMYPISADTDNYLTPVEILVRSN